MSITETRLRWIGMGDWDTVTLERFDADEDDWMPFGGSDWNSTEACEPSEDAEPYLAAEDRLLDRHGLTRHDVTVVTPW